MDKEQKHLKEPMSINLCFKLSYFKPISCYYLPSNCPSICPLNLPLKCPLKQIYKLFYLNLLFKFTLFTSTKLVPFALLNLSTWQLKENLWVKFLTLGLEYSCLPCLSNWPKLPCLFEVLKYHVARCLCIFPNICHLFNIDFLCYSWLPNQLINITVTLNTKLLIENTLFYSLTWS